MISDTLTPKQLLFLEENYRLADKESSGGSISSEDLLHPNKAAHLLERLSPMINSPSKLVTASQFSKRYAFLLTAPFFASLTLLDKVLDIRPENCKIKPDSEMGMMKPTLYLQERTTREIMDRQQDIYIALESIFRDHLTLVWERLSEVASVPFAILWENTAVYLYWLYETSFQEHRSLKSAEQIAEDFELILNAPAECFGSAENPLKKYHHQKQALLKSEPPIRVRKTCCLYYEINPERVFCKNCPRCLSGYSNNSKNKNI